MKNKKRLIRSVIALTLIITLILISTLAIADTGNHTDYYSSSSSRSSDSDSGFILDILIILIQIFGLPGALIIFIIGAVIYTIMKKSGNMPTVKEKTNFTPHSQIYKEVPDNTSTISAQIKQTDELFSSHKFIGWTKEVFITLQNAWEERDWTKIRPFEKEEIFRLHELQLQEYINEGHINKIDEINVNRAYLTEYEKDTEYEYLTVYMEVRMLDYIINESTGQLIKGNKTMPVRNRYLLTFMRHVDVKTDPAKSNMSTKNCPNCGAPLEITSAGKCEYCNFIITTGEHDWVLSNIDSL